MHAKVFRNALALVAGGVMALVAPLAWGEQGSAGAAERHTERGVAYFNEGFYDLAPHGKSADAAARYALAVREFQAAIAAQPNAVEAHRRLARVYHVQRDDQGAAAAYRRVTELTPYDVDAYVNRALALIRLNRLEQAIEALSNAKAWTTDARVLGQLDGYIAKVRAHQREEVR